MERKHPCTLVVGRAQVNMTARTGSMEPLKRSEEVELLYDSALPLLKLLKEIENSRLKHIFPPVFITS